MHWLEMSLDAGLAQLPWSSLLHGMAEHLELSSRPQPRDPWRIRPSLVADPCPLSQAKKLMGHEAQPNFHVDSVRQGRPNGGTALNFMRGFTAEALVVTCLKATGYGRVLAHAPTYTVTVAPDLEAHPDVVVDEADGHGPVLVQIKNPNHGMFQRIKDGQTGGLQSHILQVALELYITRLAGQYLPEKAYLFYLTWESFPPDTTTASGLQTLVHPVYWTKEAEVLVMELIDNLRAIRENAARGVFPAPDPQSNPNKYPHSYCNFSRFGDGFVPACIDQEKWKSQAA